MTPAVGRSLRVALLQLRAFELADHEAAWAELLRRIDEAAEPPGGEPAPQLIVAPEASYPAYYLHSRADYDAARVLPDARVEAMLAERARRHGVALTVGLVQRWPDQALGSEDPRNADLRNVAVLFAPSGQVVARTAKRFLWHFDHAWFGAGEGSPVVEVGPARCGLFICADGRLPEIPRALAVAGAELLIEPDRVGLERARPRRAVQPAGRLRAGDASHRERLLDRRGRQGRDRGRHDRLRRPLECRRRERALARASAQRRGRRRALHDRPQRRAH